MAWSYLSDSNRTSLVYVGIQYNVNPDWLINGAEPIFEDMTSELNIDDDVKQLDKQYSLLNDADRELVKMMINSLAEKINKT